MKCYDYSLITVLFVSLAVPSTQGALYTLSNGDFETPALVAGGGLANYTGTPPLSGFGWQMGGGQIDIVRVLWQPASGAQSIDLNGLIAGTIYQDFTFSVSGPWAVTFAMSANPDSSAVKTMNVSFGPAGGPLTSLGDFSLAPGTRTYQNMQWVSRATPTFNVLDGVLYQLQFTSTIAGGYGPALDNVQLIQVPEPTSLSLLCGGLFVASRLRLRKPGC